MYLSLPFKLHAPPILSYQSKHPNDKSRTHHENSSLCNFLLCSFTSSLYKDFHQYHPIFFQLKCNIFTFSFCPPLNLSFKILPLLCTFFFYITLLDGTFFPWCMPWKSTVNELFTSKNTFLKCSVHLLSITHNKNPSNHNTFQHWRKEEPVGCVP